MPVRADVVNLKEVTDFVKSLPSSIFKTYKTELARTLFEADASIKENTDLQRRSGVLMSSITTRIEGTSFANLKADIYTDSVYARIHEEGGEVKAKNAYHGVMGGPYLNIPTSSNKTAAGVQRMTPKTVFARGGLIVEYKQGKYGVMLNGTMMFTLHKSVTIPAGLHMVSSVEDTVPTFLSRVRDAIGEE